MRVVPAHYVIYRAGGEDQDEARAEDGRAYVIARRVRQNKKHYKRRRRRNRGHEMDVAAQEWPCVRDHV